MFQSVFPGDMLVVTTEDRLFAVHPSMRLLFTHRIPIMEAMATAPLTARRDHIMSSPLLGFISIMAPMDTGMGTDMDMDVATVMVAMPMAMGTDMEDTDTERMVITAN